MFNKFMKFLGDVAKILSLLIAYLLVKTIPVNQKPDQDRKEWALDVLRFYNYLFLIIVCFLMIVRLFGPKLRAFYQIFVPSMVLISLIFQTKYVFSGWPLCFQKSDEYDDQDQKSYSMEFAFWLTFLFNLLVLIHLVGVTCYILILMRAL